VAPEATPTLRLARPDEIETLIAIDDDAGALYAEAGMHFTLAADDPFVLLERERWSAALRAGRVELALTATGEAVGFAALGTVDGAPYLDQLSVRRAHMRQGLGTRLLERALQTSADDGALWLTTYAHLAFNRPFYERAGFVVVPDAACGPDLRAILDLQRRTLPRPEHRVAMRCAT
jgi:GNAT superfamily N-acetyltransferase